MDLILNGKKHYLYQFSWGEYSDYRVGGVFLCDHEVTLEEWGAHESVYSEEAGKRSREFNIKWQHATYDKRKADPDLDKAYRAEWEALNQWRKDNDPEESFVKLHNMVPIQCIELRKE
jgi:hypothetical protein